MGKTDKFGDNPRRVGLAERCWAPYRIKLTPHTNYVCKNGFIRFFYYIVALAALPVIYIMCRYKWGFEAEGIENVRELKGKSAVTVSNHVHDLDSLMLTYPFFPDIPHIVALKHNFEMVFFGFFVRVLRAIPLPDPEDRDSFARFRDEVVTLLRAGKRKVHVFPEGSIDPYCERLRNFKKGAFYFAVHCNVPIVPMVFVYPRPRKIKLLVAKPIYPDRLAQWGKVSEPKLIVELANRTRRTMERMSEDFYRKEGVFCCNEDAAFSRERAKR